MPSLAILLLTEFYILVGCMIYTRMNTVPPNTQSALLPHSSKKIEPTITLIRVKPFKE